MTSEYHTPAVTASINSQGSVFQIHVPARVFYGGGLRGNVTTFSAGSRRRMIGKLARLQFDPHDISCMFLTLTYRDVPTQDESKAHLRALLKRLMRYAPESCGIWRVEAQQRGCPHYHLIWIGGDFLPFRKLRQWWCEITGQMDLFVRIERVRTKRGVMWYVSKYMAKEGDQTSPSDLSPSEASEEGPALLDYVAYWADWGRRWGVFAGDKLPVGQLMFYADTFGRWFWRLKRIAKRLYSGIRSGPSGYTVYGHNPERMWEAYVWAIDPDHYVGNGSLV